MKKMLIILLALALYCNIGWVMGDYYLHQIFPAKYSELNLVGKIAAGGWGIFAQGDKSQAGRTAIIALFGVIWPIGLVFVVIMWIVYFVYYVGWFIFAGGAAKLLGFA